MKITLPKWYDLHLHLRQEELLEPIVKSQIDMGCCGVLGMPNTKPPTAKVFETDDLPYWSLEKYMDDVRAAGGDAFQDFIVPLYLTKDTTPDMIAKGAESGLLRAGKYYPPHGTTGADFAQVFDEYMDNGVFAAMEEHDVVLCIHGEQHHMEGEEYFDKETNAEDVFYKTYMPELIEKFPKLRVACEHLTTRTAVDFVKAAPDNVMGSITPQHLLYTVGHLLMGLKYHLYCMPLLKFDSDRHALREAVVDPNNTKFYAGTDSAPHTVKATPCGCAAGCFTGGIAPQLYAQAFEEAGVDMSSEHGQRVFEEFLCHIGPRFYRLEPAKETMTLEKTPQEVSIIPTAVGDITPLPVGLGQETIPWKLL